jgi:hypothetical protein
MDRLTRQDLRTLAMDREGPCVSLYLPTHRDATHAAEDRVRLRNLVRRAEAELCGHGLRPAQASEMLDPVRQLSDDPELWRHPSDGLAVFRTPDAMSTWRLPWAFPEESVVGPRLRLTPLLPIADGDERFYVLALSQKSVRLLAGTREDLAEVPLEDVPTSLSDALKLDVYERQMQFHTGTLGSGGGRRSVFFGSGSDNEDVKGELSRYFRTVDDGVREHIGTSGAPLVLAGVDYLFPIYRDVSRTPSLAAGHVSGNPDQLSLTELHRRTWEAVAPAFDRGLASALVHLEERTGSELVSSKLEEIVGAAAFGRVEALFVDRDARAWGTFDASSGTAEAHAEHMPGDDELVDLAAMRTFRSDGEVYLRDRSEMPADSPVTAILRY